MPHTQTSPEQDRLDAVHRFLQLDYDRSSEFQDIVELAAQLCDVPVALITLLDEDVNWVKAHSGMDVTVMPRNTSFCQYAIQTSGMTIVHDAAKDERFDKNPMVQSQPNIRFYAGAPLTISSGLRLGTLCLFDGKPNQLSELQQKTMTILSRQVTFFMELQLSHKVLQQHVQQVEERNESLRRIAHMQSHDIRQPLTSIMGLINTIREDNYVADKERLLMMEDAANDLDAKIHAIVVETTG